MLKTTLIAAAAVSLMALGATDAFAGKGGGHGGGGYGQHGGGHHGGGHGGYHGGKHHHRGYGWYRYPSWWFAYTYPRCHYQPRKVRIRAYDRRGRAYYRWVWRDVRVC